MHPYVHHANHFRRILRRRQRVLLTITKDPDGDSLGAMLGMAHAMQHYGKDYVCFSPDPMPAMFDFLRGPHQIVSDLPDPVETFHLVIIFDAGDVKRTPLVAALVKRDVSKTAVLNIDHHPTVTDWNQRSAIDHNFIDTQAGATTEMLFHLFQELGVPLNAHAATCLLTGILTDTGHFTNHGTSLNSFEIAAQLMAQGAAHRTITRATMRNKSLGTLKLWGRALSRLTLNKRTGVVSTVLLAQDFEDCGVDHRASTGIANLLNNLREGRMALVLHEHPGGVIKGSLRTARPDVDVAEFAQQFGGGGHPKAAGFTLTGRIVKSKEGWQVRPLAKTDQA